jgi:hypothetical protein
VGQRRTQTIPVPEQHLGLAGSHQTFLVHFTKSTEPTPPHEGVGPFTVTVVLATTEAVTGNGSGIDLSHDRGGDSLLEVPGSGALSLPLLDLYAEDPTLGGAMGAASGAASSERAFLHLQGYANQHRRLARLVALNVPAASEREARARVLAAVRSVLAHWSFVFDRPIRIGRVVVACETTKDLWTQTRTPFLPTRLSPPPTGTVPAALSVALDFYAEALAASSPTFEFLCYYKAAEVIRRFRDGVQKDLAACGQPLLTTDRFRPDVSEELWGREVRQLAPRSFKDVLGNELRETRNVLAHAFLDDDGTPLAGPADIERVLARARAGCNVIRFIVRSWVEEILQRMEGPSPAAGGDQGTEPVSPPSPTSERR